MKDELTRRNFLKAAGLAVAGIAGSSVLSRSAWAQEQKPEEPAEPTEPTEKAPEEPRNEDESQEDPNHDDLFEEKESEEEETRACPQCGALMYRQGRTWTCENCGYSYVE